MAVVINKSILLTLYFSFNFNTEFRATTISAFTKDISAICSDCFQTLVFITAAAATTTSNSFFIVLLVLLLGSIIFCGWLLVLVIPPLILLLN